MKPYDLIKVVKTTTVSYMPDIKGEIGKVVELVEEKDGVDYYKCAFIYQGKPCHFLLSDEDVEVIYDEKDRKYSFDLYKLDLLRRYGDLTTALFLQMGGDYHLHGVSAEIMRNKGRFIIPQWYEYDIENAELYSTLQ